MYIAYVFRAMLIKQSNMRESNDEIASQAQIRPIPSGYYLSVMKRQSRDTQGIFKSSASLTIKSCRPQRPRLIIRSWFFNCLTWSTRCPKNHHVSSTPIHLLHHLTSEQTTAGYRPGLHSQDLCFAREEGRCVFRRRVPTDGWAW